ADEAVAAADADPVLVNRPVAVADHAGAAPAAVVLQAAVDVVVPPRVHIDVVELADRHLIEEVPVGHAVVGDVVAAGAADEHVAAVLRVDPQRVLVGGAPAAAGAAAAPNPAERFAAVGGAVDRHAEGVDVLVVAGVHADLAEVHRPRVEAVDAHPGFA